MRVLESFKERLEQVDELLVAGEGTKSYKKVERLIEDMSSSFVGGAGTAPYLGTAVVLRALAHYQCGRIDDAIWDYQVAVQLLPEVAEFKMTAYGDAGEFLRRHPPREPEPKAVVTEDSGTEEPLMRKEVVPPKRRRSKRVQFPRGMRRTGEDVIVRIQAIIEEDGRVREPVFMESKGELTMVLALASSMRSWRYKPAELDGEPVAVYFVLSARFRPSL